MCRVLQAISGPITVDERWEAAFHDHKVGRAAGLVKPRGSAVQLHAPAAIRTRDLRLRRPTLYPAELLARKAREQVKSASSPCLNKDLLHDGLTVPRTRPQVRAPTRESTMLRRAIAGTLLLCYLAACTSWHVEKEASALQLISTKHPRVVRLTRADGSRIVLEQPRIAAGDTLAGVHNGVLSGVAARDVTEVATSKVSAGKTIGLFLGLSTVAVGIAVIACLSGPGCAYE